MEIDFRAADFVYGRQGDQQRLTHNHRDPDLTQRRRPQKLASRAELPIMGGARGRGLRSRCSDVGPVTESVTQSSDDDPTIAFYQTAAAAARGCVRGAAGFSIPYKRAQLSQSILRRCSSLSGR
jgi:hypothetical protein